MIPKFRAWLKQYKEMVDEVNDMTFFEGNLEFIGCRTANGVSFQYCTDDIILMQSTGLYDKNGKEIFEKDILDYNGRKVIVKWHGSYASFIYEFVDELQNRTTEWQPLYLSYYHFEIIGNVYENPELLEVTE
jgi:hypothetical protein